MLKQIGMGASVMECNRTSFVIEFINKYPIALNMTVKRPFPTAMKRVIIAFRRQGLFVDDHVHDFNEFIKIHTTLLHQPVLFSERFGIKRFKHGLIVQVIPFKVFNHFCKGMKPFGGNFPSRNSHAFLNGGYSLGIVARISGYRIAVRGTDRTFARKSAISDGCRGKGKYSSSRRYFMGYVNNQPVVGWHFYGLRNAHGVNIA
jgi:hypothetical protein